MNSIFAFWFAYVVTRPVGASFADWLGKPRKLHGLGFGSGNVSLVLTLLIIILVGYLAITKADVQLAARHSAAPEQSRQRQAAEDRVP